MPKRSVKPAEPAPLAQTQREHDLVARIRALYAEYTGQEIAQAIGQYRAEETARQEQIKIREEIARLQSQIQE